MERQDTAPELRLRHRLWHEGHRYRKHLQIPRTRPDLAFIGRRVTVFVARCYWHGCPEHYTAPVGNAGYGERSSRVTRQEIGGTPADWKRGRLEGGAVLECEVNEQLDRAVGRLHRAVEIEY